MQTKFHQNNGCNTCVCVCVCIHTHIHTHTTRAQSAERHAAAWTIQVATPRGKEFSLLHIPLHRPLGPPTLNKG